MDKEIQSILLKTNKDRKKIFFKKIANLIKKKVGYKLLTFTVIDKSLSFVERIYTTNSKIYPINGVKPIPNNKWKAIVIKKKQNFSLNTKEKIKKIFFDYEIIFSLGCGSIVNYLLIFEGKHLGTINILHEEKFYNKVHLEKLKLISNLLLPHFLQHQNKMKKKKIR
tara:strand:- start:162 stop:662 length:501 start_codon:yes stop_codon:yes gene_type:complete